MKKMSQQVWTAKPKSKKQDTSSRGRQLGRLQSLLGDGPWARLGDGRILTGVCRAIPQAGVLDCVRWRKPVSTNICG